MATLDKLKDLIAEEFDVEVSELSEATTLKEDLEADSLTLVEMVMSVEDEFDVELGEDEITSVNTIGELATLIDSKK
jgi:acyl carrier protein